MPKTVKQIADEIGVSKQAVQKRMSREPLYTCIQPYISTNQGTKYIDVYGEKLVIEAFTTNCEIPVSIPTSIDTGIDKTDTMDTLVYMLKNELDIKNKQLDVKDKQIEDLAKTIENLSTALASAQLMASQAQALHAGTIHKQLIEDSSEDVAGVSKPVEVDNIIKKRKFPWSRK